MVHQTPEAAVRGSESRTIKISIPKNEASITKAKGEKVFLTQLLILRGTYNKEVVVIIALFEKY